MPTRSRPILIYDGDCHFCRRWIARWHGYTEDRVEYAPFQEVAADFPGIPSESFRQSVQLVEPDGRVTAGAEAVFRALSFAPGRRWPLWAYENLPGAARASERCYRIVAGHRAGFSLLTRWLWGQHVEPPSFFLSRWVFLKLLGSIYLIAFLSLGFQIPGLIGENGILPAAPWLKAVGAEMGSTAYHLFPTLCWIGGAGEGFLTFLWAGGAILSGLLILGIAPAPILFVLWAFYLSLCTVSRDFLSFQWDILLLEVGFLAAFFAPWRILPSLARESAPSPAVLWLLRWLLFRLLFLSGAVKLTGGDPTWWSLSALQVHYETQPLPTWIGWYAHQLPGWFQRFSCGAMFVIELAVPFLIFLPRRPRIAAFWPLVFLQVLIGLTGNYTFFNLLTIALCLLLLDDASLRKFFPARVAAASLAPRPEAVRRVFRRSVVAVLATVILTVSSFQLYGAFARVSRWPAPVGRLMAWVSPFRSISRYGLFAHMTTTRPEIIVEGSNDRETWLAYEFKWKPGDPRRRPAFVEPHQPRLDWQMWFAALADYRSTPWFRNFVVRLLQGSPEVLDLLETNPFPGGPPRYARAVLYQYNFTDLQTKRREGTWWRREQKGLYLPVVSLRAE